MPAPKLEFRKVTGHCGAEVHGIDLARPLGAEVVDVLSNALAEHCVLFFHEQSMTPAQQKALGRHFGELHIHPAWPRLVDGHPEVMEIYADENTRRIAGEDWHSDVSCDREPPLGTILQMLEVPPVGGDTLFANMYAAYESLPDALKQSLLTMRAEHSAAGLARRNEESPGTDGRQIRRIPPPVEHPVVRTHPETGRRALYVNPYFTSRMTGMEQKKSISMLASLNAHATREENLYRHRWKPGDLVMWDNRCTMHYAVYDYDDTLSRLMHRTTAAGDRPV
jgi:taurine dioxygenase